MTDRNQARQRWIEQPLDDFGFFWYLWLVVIAPVKMGSDTFQERIPGPRIRRLVNDQKDVFFDHERRK